MPHPVFSQTPDGPPPALLAVPRAAAVASMPQARPGAGNNDAQSTSQRSTKKAYEEPADFHTVAMIIGSGDVSALAAETTLQKQVGCAELVGWVLRCVGWSCG